MRGNQKIASDQFASTGYTWVPSERVVVMFSNNIYAKRFRNIDEAIAREQYLLQGPKKRQVLEISLYTDIRGQ